MNQLRVSRSVCLLLAAATCAAAAAPLHAQGRRSDPPSQTQLTGELGRLREAATLELNGDVAAAEKIVRGVLETNPTSLSALLALERLLSGQGRIDGVIAAVDRLLERDPTSMVGHQTRLRIVAQGTNPAAIEAAVAAWIRATPKVETPYREAALVWRQHGEHQRAIDALEQGRKRVERADALALELGDAYLAVGDVSRAAAEWVRAVGPEGRGLMLVQRRLQNLADGGARLIPLLVDQMASPKGPRNPGRFRAAALLAIDAGLAAPAQRFATELVNHVKDEERDAALIEIARRADGAELYGVASWAYGELLRANRDPGAALAIQSRLAELALLSGDTATAAAAYLALEKAAAVGSPQRRQALAVRIQLTAREGEIDRAAAELQRLRSEYAYAPELEETAAAVAQRYVSAGQSEAAEKALAGINGPRAAQLRGRIALARGDLERARVELMSAAPLLRGAEATETIALAALITRISPAAAELLAHAISTPVDEREAMLQTAAQRARALPARDQTAILDFLADIADRSGYAADADQLRRELATHHPRAQETPAALLSLAQRALAKPETAEEARVLLEKIILEYPRSALMPQARRELERLHSRMSAR